MAKEKTVGVVPRADELLWTVLSGAAATSGREALSVLPTPGEPAPESSEAETVAAVTPPTLAEQLATAGVDLRGPVSVGLDTDRLLLRVVRLPASDPEELAGMIELQVDKLSPFPIETMAVSHEVLKSDADGQTVLVAAVKKTVADELRDRLTQAGLNPVRLDATALAWWHLLREDGKTSATGWEVLLVMARAQTEMIVLHDGVPAAFRPIEVNPGAPVAQTAAALAEEIEYTLMSLELEYGPRGACLLTVWHSGDDEPRDLVAALKSACACEVRAFPLGGLPAVSEGLVRRAQTEPAGLDLTPAAWRDTASQQQFKRRMVAAFAGVAALWLLLVGGFAGGLAFENYTLKRLEAEKTVIGKEALEVREMRRRVATIQRYTNQTYSALECLRVVSEAKPPGVDLSSFAYRKGEGVKISGTATAVGLVYDMKKRLDETDLFRQKTDLEQVRLDPKRNRQVFDLSLPIPGGGAEP